MRRRTRTNLTPDFPFETVNVSPDVDNPDKKADENTDVKRSLPVNEAKSGIPTLVFHPVLKEVRKPLGDTDAQFSDRYGNKPARRPDDCLEEAINLAAAINLSVEYSLLVPTSKIKPSTFIGQGKVDDIKALVEDLHIELVVADCSLSPVQQRNLERAWNVKVIDRTGLILEIFGARAQTREGRLQVELANLTYQKSRLVRSWTHLERQRGGLGKTGGPGETQIEADRRQIDERIAKIRRALEAVVRTRELHRSSRRKVPYPIVALVGYTNAGKSTLFNRLTRSDVMAEDMLFATLDPTMRQLHLPSGRQIILSDTVGFISDLPTHLVAAFRATLEEVLEADIIVHVRDISHPDTAAQRADVLRVLSDLEVNKSGDRKFIEVLNKTDLLPESERKELGLKTMNHDQVIALSAVTGDGIHNFQALLDHILDAGTWVETISLPHSDGAGLAWLYRHGEVVDRKDRQDEVCLQVRLDATAWGQFQKREYLNQSANRN